MLLLLSMRLAFALAQTFTPADLDFDKGTYFAVQFQSAPFAEYLKKAEKDKGAELRTRGESHLTVVTPPEYIKLTADQRKGITAALKALDWSKPDIKIICVGRGQAVLKDQVETAYFLVVEAPEIAEIRKRFKLGDYYPHVTLGFTKRDLHFEDGVKKDSSACLKDSAPAH